LQEGAASPPGGEGVLIRREFLASILHECLEAIDLTQEPGVAGPIEAILAAVESVNPEIPSTLEAGALCKMCRPE
jgi:hypothetical protein